MHNTIRSDRYNATQYQDELSMLKVKNNKSYSLTSGNQLATAGNQNVSTGLGLDIDIDIELDKDKEKDKDKNNKAADIKYFPLDDKLNKTFLDFINMRKSIKAKMTDRAIELMIKKIEKLDSDTAVAMMEQSIMNGWKDIYPVKDEHKTKSRAQQAQDDFINNAKEWLSEQ